MDGRMLFEKAIEVTATIIVTKTKEKKWTHLDKSF